MGCSSRAPRWRTATPWTCSSPGTPFAILRPETLDAGSGIGTGGFREHVDALITGGATLYASGLSSKARGLGPDALGGLPVTMAPPDRLVELTFAADRVLVY